MSSQPTKATLTEGNVVHRLINLTAPMLFAVFSFVLFNLVDTYFIGQLGTVELAAVSFTFPVVLLIGSLAQGLGIGASAVISRFIGQGESDRVRRLTTDSLILAFILVSCFSITGLLTIDPLFTLLGATEDVLVFIREYVSIYYVALMFVVIPLVGNAAIRATGDMRTPAAIMFIAVLVNIVLDPLLIFGIGPFPEWGVRGAAIATGISRATALVGGLYVLHYRERMIIWALPKFGALMDSWRRILYVGIPAAATQMLIPISTAVITAMVASYGTTAVAAFGVASRIETFGLAVFLALGGTLTPFIGQNWGAGRGDRVREAIRASQIFSIFWGAIFALLLLIFGRQIAGIFNDSPEVIDMLYRYLLIVPISYGLAGILQVVNSSLNALNRPIESAILSVLRLGVIYIPVAVIGSQIIGLDGIFLGAAVANIGAGVLAFGRLRYVLNRNQKRVTVVAPSVTPTGGD